ncbi:MAG: nucleotidyl transferase AbiEii/AbiGii toxin family protein [Phycisphaerae bacterium]|nr:nucleotidyl transferase AbiEii/AbiGii toxin family protein [Phycisphaerae bacterium]
MIPENYLREWKEQAPWKTDGMVEQDLIICRSLVALFSEPVLSKHLAFRGGTALHKLHLAPASRYSEDIDLVQVVGGPIGHIFDALRRALGDLLGKPQRKQGPGVVTVTYKMAATSAASQTLRLKVEINSREHFAVLGVTSSALSVSSRWFSGSANIPTYCIEELLGTKLRAMYQRRKGRDLFDLWLGLSQGKANPELIGRCFHRYMAASDLRVSAREYQLSMEPKLVHPDFVYDTDDLLRPGVNFDLPAAYAVVEREIISRLDAFRDEGYAEAGPR